jgi:hypothetical protein
MGAVIAILTFLGILAFACLACVAIGLPWWTPLAIIGIAIAAGVVAAFLILLGLM